MAGVQKGILVAKPTTLTNRVIDPEKLRQHRLDRGLTQMELSVLATVSSSMIASLENGRRKGRLPTLRRIANALRLNLADITVIEVRKNGSS